LFTVCSLVAALGFKGTRGGPLTNGDVLLIPGECDSDEEVIR